MDDVLAKAHDPDSLAKRIATARRQMSQGMAVEFTTTPPPAE
jgi:hypothetical protein